MNETLASDLSPKEIKWNKAEIDETNPAKVLKVIDVRFEPKEQDSQPSIKVLRLKNTGVLAFDLLLKYPKDDEDEPENWVDKDLQGEEELKLNYMLENKLFICEPRRAHLEVDEEIDLIISYKHTVGGDPNNDFKPLYNGDFRLPIILNVCELPAAGGVINSGKQIVLNCIGKTLAPHQPFLHLPQPDSARFPRLCWPHLRVRTECDECRDGFDTGRGPPLTDYELLGSDKTPYQWGFERTPIGLLQPPIQYYKVANLGSVPFELNLDLQEVEGVNKKAYDFQVVSLLDNTTSILEPGQSVLLRWVFNPLEAKTYTWKVPFHVHTDDHDFEVDVFFTAEGFQENPHARPVTTALPLPLYQVMPIPNQAVFLSEERLCLGDIPIGASMSRIIFLTNYHQDEFMDYAFVLSSSLAQDVLEVFPSEGEIAPESHVAVRVTVRCMVASVFDFDVPVLVRTKPPPAEENEDLADENEGGGGGEAPMGSARPATGAPSTARSNASSAGGDKAKKKKRKVSIVEQPPPAHKTMKAARAGGKGNVSFVDKTSAGSKSGTSVNKSMSLLDDAASVRSGNSSRVSGMTGATGHSGGGGGGSQASGYSGSVAGSKMGADDDDAVVDMSLHLSIQANVRPLELHKSMYQNDKFFWFPKGSLLPTDSAQYSLPEDLAQTNKTTRTTALDSTAVSRAGKTPAKTPGGDTRPATNAGALSTRAVQGPPPMRMAVTESLLEALLNDVLGDDDVANALQQLDKPPAPCYVQLAKAPPAPFAHEVPEAAPGDDAADAIAAAPGDDAGEQEAATAAEQGPAVGMETLQPEMVRAPSGTDRGAQIATIESPRGGTRGGTAALVMQQRCMPAEPMVLAGCDVPGHSAHVPVEQTDEEREAALLFAQRRAVMRLPEFENLAHFVLDACVFNLIEEATFGEDSVVDPTLQWCEHGKHWVDGPHSQPDAGKPLQMHHNRSICVECVEKLAS